MRNGYRDGMWDILVGYLVLVFAIRSILRSPMGELWSTAIFFPIGIVVWLPLMLVRKYIVAPRADIVILSRARRKRISWTFFLIFVLQFVARIAGFDLLDLTEDPSWETAYKFGIMIIALFSTPALLLKFRRLYIYGILIAGSPLVGELMYEQFETVHHGYPIVFGITATILILTGLILFMQVMRGAPDSANEASSQDV